MDNRALFYKTLLYTKQHNSPVPIGDGEHVNINDDRWFLSNRTTGESCILSNRHLKQLREALSDYVTSDLIGEVRNIANRIPHPYIVANNGTGVLHLISSDNGYRLYQLNACIYFVMDLDEKKVYILKEYFDSLYYFLSGGVEYMSSEGYITRVQKYIVDTFRKEGI